MGKWLVWRVCAGILSSSLFSNAAIMSIDPRLNRSANLARWMIEAAQNSLAHRCSLQSSSMRPVRAPEATMRASGTMSPYEASSGTMSPQWDLLVTSHNEPCIHFHFHDPHRSYTERCCLARSLEDQGTDIYIYGTPSLTYAPAFLLLDWRGEYPWKS